MTKTFIIIAIIFAVVAYIWYNLSQNTSNESFKPINMNTNTDLSNNYADSNNGYSNDKMDITNNDSYDCEETNNFYNSEDIVREDDNGLIIHDSIVTYNDNTQESDDKIRKKFITKNNIKKTGYKKGSVDNQLIDYIDESNDLMQSGYSTNDQFVGHDINEGQYAPHKPEKKKTDKFKASEIFNSRNYLPNEKSVNSDWFDQVPEPISVKNRHLINVSKPIGFNTIGSSLRNPSYDIRGSPPNPKFVISPWMQSTIEPDNNFKSLC